MDPEEVKSKLQGLAFGNVLAAAARDYKKEVIAKEKAHAAPAIQMKLILMSYWMTQSLRNCMRKELLL